MIHSDNYFQELPLRYDGAWIAAYWQRRPLRLLQRCLVCQAVCRFFCPLGSIITRHNQFWFSKASWKSPSELVLSVWQWKLTNYSVERIGDNIWDTHTHTMHKEWEEQLCSYMAPLRMPSFHSMGMNVHLVFIYIIWYINIINIYIFVEKCTCVPCKRLI